MRKLLGVTVAVILFVIVAAIVVRARQDKSRRSSPPATAKCELTGGKSITIDYSSPRVKGRKIYGDLVPFGQVWRAGANEATTFVTISDVVVSGKTVPAGSYTIFTIPTPDKWTLIFNKKTGEWGIPYKYESDELARVEMNVSKLSAPLENFTIAFDKSGSACTLQMDWETTRASVEIVGR